MQRPEHGARADIAATRPGIIPGKLNGRSPVDHVSYQRRVVIGVHHVHGYIKAGVDAAIRSLTDSIGMAGRDETHAPRFVCDRIELLVRQRRKTGHRVGIRQVPSVPGIVLEHVPTRRNVVPSAIDLDPIGTHDLQEADRVTRCLRPLNLQPFPGKLEVVIA